MAFKRESEFAAEFALRTQLNFLTLLEKEQIDRGDESGLVETRAQLSDIKRKMNVLNYVEVDYCLGTQLMNSLLGLLVIPQQQFFDDFESLKSWKDLPTLKQYIKEAKDQYKNTYLNSNNVPERKYNYPGPILRHMRNAAAHKKFNVYPVSATNNATNEVRSVVTHIVFKDDKTEKFSNGKKIKYEFLLRIQVEDLQPILFEISDFIIEKQLKNIK